MNNYQKQQEGYALMCKVWNCMDRNSKVWFMDTDSIEVHKSLAEKHPEVLTLKVIRDFRQAKIQELLSSEEALSECTELSQSLGLYNM